MNRSFVPSPGIGLASSQDPRLASPRLNINASSQHIRNHQQLHQQFQTQPSPSVVIRHPSARVVQPEQSTKITTLLSSQLSPHKAASTLSSEGFTQRSIIKPVFVDNDSNANGSNPTQNSPLLGGSSINLNSTATPTASASNINIDEDDDVEFLEHIASPRTHMSSPSSSTQPEPTDYLISSSNSNKINNNSQSAITNRNDKTASPAKPKVDCNQNSFGRRTIKMKSRPKRSDRIVVSIDTHNKTTEHSNGLLSQKNEPISLPTNSEPTHIVNLETKQTQHELSQQTESQQTQPQPRPPRIQISPQRTSDHSTAVDEKNMLRPVKKPVYLTPKSHMRNLDAPFDWITYSKLRPFVAAPREAFMQSAQPLENRFIPNMKLEAKDPRNTQSWCLATVISTEGLRMRLRFDGGDTMNDFYELVDSENIRPVNSCPDTNLFPPTAFQLNLSSYPKYVEKILLKPDTVIAPPECFYQKPARPEKNLFKVGMKLEAVDHKNRSLICPATVEAVNGAEIKITFDGWRSHYSYSCNYYSRDIFPVNWCGETNHHLMPPNNWGELLNGKLEPSKSEMKKSETNKPGARKSELNRSESRKQETSKFPKIVLNRTTPSPNFVPRVSRPAFPMRIKKTTSKKKVRETVEDDTFVDDSPNEEFEKVDPLSLTCRRAISIDEWKRSKLELNSTGKRVKCDESESKGESSSQETILGDLSGDAPSTSSKTATPKIDLGETVPTNASRVTTSPWKTLENETIKTLPKTIAQWTVEDVLKLINSDVTLAKYSDIFRVNEFDGKAFSLLNVELMTNLGIKMGPALKIYDLVEQVKRLK